MSPDLSGEGFAADLKVLLELLWLRSVSLFTAAHHSLGPLQLRSSRRFEQLGYSERKPSYGQNGDRAPL